MVAYKLFRKLKNGDLAPLFINKKQRIPFNKWLKAENHVTKGYAERPGWHCTASPQAPHLSTKDRVWCIVDIQEVETVQRPGAQGGEWLLAKYMRVVNEL